MKSLIVGHGGRESSLGWSMAKSSQLYAFMAHLNPTLVGLVRSSGGEYTLGDVSNPKAVVSFAQEMQVEMVMVSSDDPLAAGVVDALVQAGVPTVGPTREGAEIEWNKFFSRKIVDEIAPYANPTYKTASTIGELETAVSYFGTQPIVIKPAGLSGGKGVKVVGVHLRDNKEAFDYGADIITSGRLGGAVIVEERINGPEFTIQAMTDGKTIVFPPPTYDYPYRFDGDTGPGTGGMGSFNFPDMLPFVPPNLYTQACEIVQKVVDYLSIHQRRFSGCINAGFFATNQTDLRVIEFNARFGDPECMNIMTLFQGNWTDVMAQMINGKLALGDVPLRNDASVVIYLVTPDYALRPSEPVEFLLDVGMAEDIGCHVWFSAAQSVQSEQPGGSFGRYRTVGTSRAVAFAVNAADITTARNMVVTAIEASVKGPLEWRKDIADPRYVSNLQNGQFVP
ncbi:MAG: hypothetical protein M1483_05205 [Actinobacteria bacterium]|nr:hypothetical protein [Actinomycetota bacterium]MCL6105012.1 hypothetical protein [Actinomycetota bacterium]